MSEPVSAPVVDAPAASPVSPVVQAKPKRQRVPKAAKADSPVADHVVAVSTSSPAEKVKKVRSPKIKKVARDDPVRQTWPLKEVVFDANRRVKGDDGKWKVKEDGSFELTKVPVKFHRRQRPTQPRKKKAAESESSGEALPALPVTPASV